MARALKDALLIQTKALPAANNNNATTAFDLGATAGGTSLRPVEEVELQFTCPATPSLVDTKTITFTVEDSADNVTFAAIAELATKVMTGAGGAGAATFTQTVRLPRATRRYVHVKAAVENGGGDNTAVSYTAQLLF